MDWSYELLGDDERALLGALSAFSGGFTLVAAARVCLDGDEERALTLLERLVDCSLVVAEERAGGMRYRMLETVRQYAGARLAAGGEDDRVRIEHARWCLALAEEAEPELTGEKQATWFALLEAEHDNLRSALDYVAANGESDLLLRLAVALTRFWYVHGYLAEARAWLHQAIAQGAERPPVLRRRALTAAASLALIQGDYGDATGLAEESLAVSRETGEPHLVANALSNLGAIVLAAGDEARAAVLLEEAVVRAREAGDERVAALAINNLGDLALTVGDYERAEPLFEESLALLRARGDTANVARALFNLGAVALQVGRLEDARARFRESVALGRETGDKEDLAWCLEGLAGVAAAKAQGTHAALLLAAAGALLSEMGADFKPFERQLHATTEARALDLCGPEAFAAAAEEGAALSLDEALDRALAGG
jgi:tetratricopeptide (TPR) repeat protein